MFIRKISYLYNTFFKMRNVTQPVMMKIKDRFSILERKQHLAYSFFTICFLHTGYSQNNGYTLKKEYGINGTVKSVTSYMVEVSRYTIPADTLNFFGKSKMVFTKSGDLSVYNRMFNMPDYTFKSHAVYTGTGKNISYNETSSLNSNQPQKAHFRFIWTDDYHYKIVSGDKKDPSVQYISLNRDFTIDKVVFEREHYRSEEQAQYTYNGSKPEKITYTVTTTENGETKITEDHRIIKSTDIYDNPTVIYFYEKAESRVPKSVVFKYYEYY